MSGTTATAAARKTTAAAKPQPKAQPKAAPKATTAAKQRRTPADVAAKQPTELHVAFVAWLQANGVDPSTVASPADWVKLCFSLHDEFQASPENKARNAAARQATAAKQAARQAKQLEALQQRAAKLGMQLTK